MTITEKVENYCKKLEKVAAERNPTCEFNHYKFTYKVMKKYIKVIQCNYQGIEISVWCFVDFDGNLYKAESWSKPASGIRGHIDNPIMTLGGFYK